MSNDPIQRALANRPRRLRHTPGIRRMLAEVRLAPEDFIYPLFVTHGSGIRREIASMPGQYQLSVDQLADEARSIRDLGLQAVLIFGIPEHKDAQGSDSFADDGIVQQAIRALKRDVPDLTVIADTCLCEFTDHGHCGQLNDGTHRDGSGSSLPAGYLLNDETLTLLQRIAVSQAKSGADMIAPSGMIDGMVAAIRHALDEAGYSHIPVMSYAIKYASSFYGPFRDAAEGAPQFGDRKSHQMDPANIKQAILEAELDVAQAADFLIVKPALAYLDIVTRMSARFPQTPLVAYNVSGEYSMIKAAVAAGWLDEESVVMESMIGMKRAGADLIISYHAKDICRWLKQ